MSQFEPFLYGKYIILNRLAIGGMAEVFFAKSYGVRGFQRLLVIKRILPNLSKDEEFIEMFIDEAKISVELNHANICQVTDLGKIDGNYFIAMEFVNGKDLRAILKKSYVLQKPIPVDLTLYMVSEALKGLDYAHKREDTITGRVFSVVHRDISPQNIMISYGGDIKIVDFGIAKTEFKLHRTQAGVLKGKFAYMSPEQAMGLELDARTDVFSTAIILYEMLAGDRLFLGETDFETMDNIKNCHVPLLSKTHKHVTKELDSILQKALAKNADDRFQSAGEMQMALNKYLYSNFPDFNPENLSTYMQTLFKDEIASENNALKTALSKISDEQIQKAENASTMDQENQGHQTILSPSSVKFASYRSAPSALASKLSIDNWSLMGKTAALFAIAFVVYFLLKSFLISPQHQETSIQNQIQIPAEMTFRITSIPADAVIFLNGERKGVSPLEIVLNTQTFYDLEIQKEGFVSIKKEFQTDPKDTDQTFQLERLKPNLGQIKITSNPEGAGILIDNEDTGLNTPATLENLSINQTYRIVLRKDGYRNVTQNHLLDQEKSEISVELEKITATLKIHTIPKDAVVTVDGKKREHTVERLSLNKTYAISVSKEGYETVDRSIAINSNYVEVDIELKKKVMKKGTVSVSATPWAQVIINGAVVGPSPILNYELAVGKHEVILRHPDFDDVTKQVVIKENENERVIVDLRKP